MRSCTSSVEGQTETQPATRRIVLASATHLTHSLFRESRTDFRHIFLEQTGQHEPTRRSDSVCQRRSDRQHLTLQQIREHQGVFFIRPCECLDRSGEESHARVESVAASGQARGFDCDRIEVEADRPPRAEGQGRQGQHTTPRANVEYPIKVSVGVGRFHQHVDPFEAETSRSMLAGSECLSRVDHDLSLARFEIDVDEGRSDQKPLRDAKRPEPLLPCLVPVDVGRRVCRFDFGRTRRGRAE